MRPRSDFFFVFVALAEGIRRDAEGRTEVVVTRDELDEGIGEGAAECDSMAGDFFCGVDGVCVGTVEEGVGNVGWSEGFFAGLDSDVVAATYVT